MPAAAAQTITLATRDSLLAMAQTIHAARRLAAAGYQVRVRSLKTSGDLKLDAALFTVASRVPAKEGRAFFTKELDEALLSGMADAAVHSFKDLPYESVPGINDPILFSEHTGADLLIVRKGTRFDARGEGLLIGTSSLRRIHQLQLTMPAARTLVLRGNVVTRLNKLEIAERGINALLIAGAGLRRLQEFIAQGDDYDRYLETAALVHLRHEITRFRALPHDEFEIIEFPESAFPTAPGQGVLAFQLSATAAALWNDRAQAAFPEHSSIDARARIERQIMRALDTGCHAPLGVSALRDRWAGYTVHACFSRRSTPEPISFADSVFITRRTQGNSQTIADEIRAGTKKAFWWGSLPAPDTPGLQLIPVQAFRQMDLRPARRQSALPAAIFAASPATLPWLARETALHTVPVWAAGEDTLLEIRKLLPNMKSAAAAEKGFAAALAAITQQISGRILWLGSQSGLPRAEKIAGTAPVDFLPVYENEILTAAEIMAQQGALSVHREAAETLHIVTSAAAAKALIGCTQSMSIQAPLVSCFGDSAAEELIAANIWPYHISRAGSFAAYLLEIGGSTQAMAMRLNRRTGSKNETEKK